MHTILLPINITGDKIVVDVKRLGTTMLLYLIRPSKVVLHLIYVSLEGFIFLQTWNENNIPARWELFLL